MIQTFLRAKHWQLFILTFGTLLIFQITMMASMFSNVHSSHNPDPNFMFNYMRFFPLIMAIYVAVFFGWFWSVGIGLQSRIPQNIKMNTKRFRIFFFFPVIYILHIIVFLGVIMSNLIMSNRAPDPTIFIGIFAIIGPLHLFSMFCMFYILYFVSKTIKTVELQREVKFGDYAGEFFLIWFYPSGVWIVQPKINKMVSNSELRKYEKD